MPYDVPLSASFGPLSVRGSVALVDGAALLHNLDVARRHAAPAEVLAVVKADGYGHGAARVAPVLERAGVARFGVATVEEGLELREAGVRGTIVVLGGACWLSSPGLLVEARLIPVLSSAEELVLLDEVARARGEGALLAHVKIDTGMSRIGVHVGDDGSDALAAFIDAAKGARQVRVTGVGTHFANADLGDLAFSARQVDRFVFALDALKGAGLPIEAAHMSNSAATLAMKSLLARLDVAAWVRPGLMLYGLSPFDDERHQEELRPVLSWRASVVARKRVPAGTPVSYGSTFTTTRESELAVLAVGYADGYFRSISGKGEVLFEGMRAPLRGRVCMDLTVADVTDVVEAKGAGACALGESAILLGRSGDDEIGAREMAGWAGTIPYEILTRIGPRVPRVLTPS